MIKVTRSESTTTPRRGLATTTVTWAWEGGQHTYSYHPGKGDLAEQSASEAVAREEARLAQRLGGIKVTLDGWPPGTTYARDAEGIRD